MTANVGALDRIVRFVVGVLLIAAPFTTSIALFQTKGGAIGAVLVGLVLIVTSAMRFCPLYRILGIRTCAH